MLNDNNEDNIDENDLKEILDFSGFRREIIDNYFGDDKNVFLNIEHFIEHYLAPPIFFNTSSFGPSRYFLPLFITITLSTKSSICIF